MNRIALVSLLSAFALTGLGAQRIIPAPALLMVEEGGFTLGPGTVIQAPGEARPLGETLAGYLRPATGLPLPVRETWAEPGALRLRLEPLAVLGAPEGYDLRVDRDGVTLEAGRPAGLFHGLQTLRQLLPSQVFRAAKVDGVAWTLPAVTIEDRPRFPWRGSHLDAGRHFLPMDFIKKHLDLMALHKLNVFHWHLTDDQGWRLELRNHPLLTQVGAWRRETVLPEFAHLDRPGQMRFDHTPYGGYYTQDDVREIVAYAADRFITVVPEIDLPGHCTAAIAAIPELGNVPGRKLEVATSWGVFDTILNVDDATLATLKDVLDEVLDLFPSRFIHLGGDECPRTEWAHSERALARMVREGLVPPGTTLAELQAYRGSDGKPAEHPALARLQSWFMGQLDGFLTSRGRRLIGWDEISQGGLAQGAAVMCWRDEAWAVAAARSGHDVVMTPYAQTYFDLYQTQGPEPLGAGGYLSLEQVYAFDPVPPGLTPAEAGHILGAQGQLWTEFVADPARAEYQLWPRLAALSEVLWSPPEARDLAGFLTRLDRHLERLDALDVAYHRSCNVPEPP
jgi:hexosaminidase